MQIEETRNDYTNGRRFTEFHTKSLILLVLFFLALCCTHLGVVPAQILCSTNLPGCSLSLHKVLQTVVLIVPQVCWLRPLGIHQVSQHLIKDGTYLLFLGFFLLFLVLPLLSQVFVGTVFFEEIHPIPSLEIFYLLEL